MLDVNIEARDGILMATFAGQTTLSGTIESYKKVFDAAAERGLDKVFVDSLAVRTLLSEVEKYELGTALAHYSMVQKMTHRIAVLGKPPVATGLGALVYSNRSGDAKLFFDRQQALDWLNAKRPPVSEEGSAKA
jgi:hypothetical protein